MERLQHQMMSNIEKVSPEALMQSWFTFDPKIAERFQDMFVTMAGPRRGARRHQEITMRWTDAKRRSGRASSARPFVRQVFVHQALGLLLAEVRGIFEFNTSLLLSAALDARAEGRWSSGADPAGFLASDLSMAPMRRYLKELGYDPYAWENGPQYR